MNSDRCEPFYNYRDRTLALLRRYYKTALQIGRLPALLGREVFRARVTSYRMTTFEDAVIFVIDVERCLERLCADSQDIIARAVFENYTFREIARSQHVPLVAVHRQYDQALDELSEIFLNLGILTAIGEPSRRASELPDRKPVARVDLEACQAPLTAFAATKLAASFWSMST